MSVTIGLPSAVHGTDGVTPTVFALYLPEEQAIGAMSHVFKKGADVNPQFGPNSSWGWSGLLWAIKSQDSRLGSRQGLTRFI